MLRPDLALEEMTDRSAWEEFVAGQPHATFLQSWDWGEFQKALHRKVRRLAVLEDGRMVAAALMVVTHRRLASYAYVPYGPVLDWKDKLLAAGVLGELVELARSDGVHYLRLDPHVQGSAEVEATLGGAGFRRAVTYVQAPIVWVLDLEGKQETDLQRDMRTTTRQLVKNSEKMGVTVEVTDDPKRVEDFLRLLSLTGLRQRFIPQDSDYLRLQFKMLASAGISRLFLASAQGEVRAGAVINFYGDNASYLHGASKPSRFPTSHAVQWAAIKEALARHMKLYDMWGVFPPDHPNPQLQRVAFFKKGFGGREIRLAGAWDHPFHWRYSAVRAVETFHKVTRRL